VREGVPAGCCICPLVIGRAFRLTCPYNTAARNAAGLLTNSERLLAPDLRPTPLVPVCARAKWSVRPIAGSEPLL